MSRTLVTGGAGFIGANLVPLLRERGDEVRVLDSLVVGDPGRLPGDVDVVEGDVRDPDAVARAMEGVDAVIHLAAAAAGRLNAARRPPSASRARVPGTPLPDRATRCARRRARSAARR